jgi:aspartyl-tRNA(Asn)/glutamyl-tRNA(Gln) amidotransferase subunit A
MSRQHDMNFSNLSLCDLGRAIGAGKLDPVTLTQTFLQTAKSHPQTHHIFTLFMEERALAEAEAAAVRAKAGARRGLLDGVPISWKDLFDTAGIATEAGSKLLKGRKPDADAEVLRRASAAGLVALGKTHMSELAFSGLGLNPMTQTPPCVNDLTAVSGGSSSGAAASVAFGLAPAAIGTDTGGSVRIPAAWNDLVGLKTTAGRVPLEGTVPLAASFDTVGPITKTVEDAAELFAILDGSPAVDLQQSSLENVRFLVLETVAFDDIRQQPLEGFERAVECFEAAGASVERGHVPAVAQIMDYAGAAFTVEAYAAWKDQIEANPDAMFPPILERFRQGAAHSGVDYVQAWQAIARLRKAYLAATAGYDAVILPTAPILPPNKVRLLSDEAYYVTENLLALRNTRIGNLLGLTGLTLPTGVPSAGILLQTPPNTEAKLLRIGVAAEAALGGPLA